ncbi:hypothetical protein BU17DRAFT_60054 [Hysterangium stoloniferum]|nr:hypothetical protein BU17DRAFT_60054 [Hysterangium stoloniferum]
MGKPAVEYSCPWCEAGVPPQTSWMCFQTYMCCGFAGHPCCPCDEFSALVAILPSTRVMDKEGGHSLKSRVIFSHSLPVVVRRHYLLLGRRLLRLTGYVEVPGSNNPSVQSKVAPASDSGPDPSVE